MKFAVIPARGGSKRIPRKNIRDFCGKPIIAYSIEVALESGLFDHVIVSTDDEEIASIARKFGAECPFVRPAELADDYASTNAVVKHAVNWYLQKSESVSLVCCIYATAPFIRANYLREGHDKIISSGKSFAFSVTSFPFPIQRAIRISNQGEIAAFCPDSIARRSQDLEDAYHDAAQFYWGRPEAFTNDDVIFSDISAPVILPRYLVQDIDVSEDWLRAESMYKALHESEAR